MAAVLASPEDVGYVVGEVLGFALFLGLGVLLLVAGLKRRAAAPPAPVWAPAAEGEWAAPPPPPVAGPPSEGATWRIVVGIVLIVIALLSGLGQLASRATYPKRAFSMPATLLGDARDPQQSATFTSQLAGSLPSQITKSEVAAYGPSAGQFDFVVIAGTGHLSSPDNELDAFRAGMVKSSKLFTISGSRDVDPGALGGKGRCYDAKISTVPLAICVFVDRGSILSIIDRTSDPAKATARAQQVHDLVMHEG